MDYDFNQKSPASLKRETSPDATMTSQLGIDNSQASATQTPPGNIRSTPTENNHTGDMDIRVKREQNHNRKWKNFRLKRRIRNMNEKALERDNQIANLTREISSQHQSISYHKDVIEQLKNDLMSESMKAEQTNAELAEMSRRAGVAEDQLLQLKTSYQNMSEKLKWEINKLKNHNQKLAAQFAEQTLAKVKAQALANSGKVSDDAILQIWKKMKYAIQNLAATLLTERPSADHINSRRRNIHSVVGSMNQKLSELLDDVDMRSSVVEHFLWRAVCERVFGPDREGRFGRVWAGAVGESFSEVVTGLKGMALDKNLDVHDFFRWRAEGSKMIEDMVGIDKNQLERVVRAETRTFSCFLPKSNDMHQDAQAKLYSSLQKIFEDAQSLHSIFMKSKADIFIEWPTPQRSRIIHYDPESMEAEMWEKEPIDRGSIVEISMSPGLVKVGTADGGHYDQSIRLVKARVVCN